MSGSIINFMNMKQKSRCWMRYLTLFFHNKLPHTLLFPITECNNGNIFASSITYISGVSSSVLGLL